MNIYVLLLTHIQKEIIGQQRLHKKWTRTHMVNCKTNLLLTVPIFQNLSTLIYKKQEGGMIH